MPWGERDPWALQYSACKSQPDMPIMQQMRVNRQVKSFPANYRKRTCASLWATAGNAHVLQIVKALGKLVIDLAKLKALTHTHTL